ncbi:MAG: multicopper oxidase domain-containing protein, partial [Gemmatimonadota bacterium]|nr:multicopper oxidase domain-containing protein [Gemmatimonadota bacterium]
RSPAPRAPRAAANDNRSPSGTVHDGVLRVAIVAQAVVWYPDGAHGCSVLVHAFAEEGRPAVIPGPLVRVQAGTEVSVSVRNSLDMPIWVRGLQDRTSLGVDSTEIAPASTHEFRFRASAPGAWYYWAGAAGKTNAQFPMSTEDGQLVGALVVDADTGPSGDRVFVMTRWTPRGVVGNADYQLNAINGRSWPNTERLSYTVGDSVRWHVINASDELHMMHLHGFYYTVNARGDAAHDSTLARQQQNVVVTVATRRGEWMSMSWSPERAGNWMFHCHFTAHMSGDQRLDRLDATTGRATHHAMTPMLARDMAGLLLGVTVMGRGGASPRAVPTRAERRLQLFASMRPRVYGARPGYGFVLQEGDRAPARDSIRVPGTPLIVARGEPVAVVVHNRTTSPFSLHWHGIELESFNDGVAGWSGVARRLAPLIAPGDSFVAHFTPARAGTFIYHAHNEPGDELASGLYAPLIVLEPGARYDPSTDRTIVIASGGPGVSPQTAINGMTSPDTMRLVANVTYRVRFIDISSNEAHAVALNGPAGVITWRTLARDGRALPLDRQLVQPARFNIAAGITNDFELVLPTPGDYTLAFTGIVGSRPGGSPTVMPIHVIASKSR